MSVRPSGRIAGYDGTDGTGAETKRSVTAGNEMDEAGAHRYRVDLQYDGSVFYGWARQPGLPTVQAALEEALRTVLGETPVLRVAGRTDAGVHARHQVVSTRLARNVNCASLARSLDALTPPELGLLNCVQTVEAFDARRDAFSRTYRYFIDTGRSANPFMRRYAWHVPHKPDTDLLQALARRVEGEQDFRAFTPTQTEHVFFRRTVLRCTWDWDEPFLKFTIEANAFLRHMVRSLVGTMTDVTRGGSSLESFQSLLEGASRSQAGRTAPAHGLFLWSVKYREEEPLSGLTPQRGSIIMPTCVSRRYGENLFG